MQIPFNKIFKRGVNKKLSIGFVSNELESIYIIQFSKQIFTLKKINVFFVFDFDNKENLLF